MTCTYTYIDTETTGLLAHRHEIWEIGLIVDEGRPAGEYAWQIRPQRLADADPFALNIGRYWDRSVFIPEARANWEAAVTEYPGKPEGSRRTPIECSRAEVIRAIRNLTAGSHLVGMLPSFDEERLRRLAEWEDEAMRWHYHIIDAEALAVGYLRGVIAARHDAGMDAEVDHGGFDPSALPWSSEDLSRAVGVEPPSGDDRHTALGDARWAREVHRKVMGIDGLHA